MNQIKTLNRGNFTIEIEERFHPCDNGRPSYKVTCKDITTGEINEEMSDTVYLSMNAVNEFINSIEETKQPEKINNSTKESKPKKYNDNIPQTEMTATYAQINFKGSIVEVVFTNNTEINIATFKYRRSWSNRKYIDMVFGKSNIKPSWDFRYGWEVVGA